MKRNIAYNFIYQILTYIIPLITTPYLSRILGASGIGEFSFAYSVACYFTMFGVLGLANYGNREIARVSHNEKKRTILFWSIYSMQLVTGLISFAAYLLYAFLFSEITILKSVMAFYVLSAVFDVSWFYFGMELFRITILRNSLLRIGTCIMIFWLVTSANDVWIYSAIIALGNLGCQLLLWPYLKKYVGRPQINFSNIESHLGPNIKLFIPVIAVSLYKIMDKIMLGLLSTNTQLGYYESAERLISIPVCFVTALGTVMLPRITNMISTGNDKNIERFVEFSLVLAVVSSSLIGFGIMGVLNEFIPLFYGDGFGECKVILWVMLPSTIFVAQANVIRTQLLIPYVKDNVYIESVILGAVVNCLANLILIPWLRAVGAAIGTLMSEFTVWLFQNWFVKKQVSMRKNILYCFPVIFVAVAMAMILDKIPVLFNSNIISLFLKTIIGTLFFMILVGSYLIVLQKKKV